MKKNISINIGKILFHIEEEGYDKLKNYLDSVNDYFSSFEDSKEIIEDIEGRIAEIFHARLNERKQVITQEDVKNVINIMGTVQDFEATIENGETQEKRHNKNESNADRKAKKEGKKLFRDTQRKIIGGVAAGLAHYFRIDPIWVRLIILVLFFNIFFIKFFSGAAFIAYIVLWITIPGHNKLKEDTAVKKLYRDPDNRVLGGICSGIASYFGVDKVAIRIIFIILIFIGAGILLYIILWIIVPEAKTVTEKMQMQGEPVTISNIEENVKKSLNAKEGEENAFIKILFFPFRLIAMIFKTLSKLIGPLLRFTVEALRVALGILLVCSGFALMIAFSMALVILLGGGDALENWLYFGSIPVEYLIGLTSVITLMASYIVVIIPSLAILLLGLTIIAKKPVIGAFVGWSMFGTWTLGIIVLAISVPVLIKNFRVENTYKERRSYEPTATPPTLRLNYSMENDGLKYDDVELRLRGHSDSVYLLVMKFMSRGASKHDARNNAQSVAYNVERIGDDFYFDYGLTFNEGAPFRFQILEATFYIPRGQTFRMDEDLAEILTNTLHSNGYRASQMEGNNWVFDENGIQCLTCARDKGRYEQDKQRGTKEEYQVYDFSNFDEVMLHSLFDFEIRRGKNHFVELRGNDLSRISLIQSGDELKIKRNMNWKWWKNKEWEREIKVFIVMPELKYLSVHGACEGEVIGFNDDKVKLKLDGASEITAELESRHAYVDISGVSQLTLIGHTDHLEADITGASGLYAYDFKAEEADIKATGASTARVHVRQELEAQSTGASVIRYRGNPIVYSKSKGFGSVKKD